MGAEEEYTDHIAFFGIGDHALHLISYTLLGETTGEFLTRTGLASVKDNEATPGGFQFFDERIFGRRDRGVRGGPADRQRRQFKKKIGFFRSTEKKKKTSLNAIGVSH